MTCADTTMLRSVMQHATAHYIATALFAITLVVARGLRILWRRRPRRGGYRKRRPRRRRASCPSLYGRFLALAAGSQRMGIRVAATAGPNCSRWSVISVLLFELWGVVPVTRFARH
ncbi:hypothetical protein C5746_41905 [Streptomyces atratus]|uniref:Uncharacterized protein n=1 Tax=Streptomyces atratus TaxID=1893 RepID=A0A2Z5JQ22_STRAR|nr:hypothetical protein C5746_41905 [Streptomyces atratus]